MNLEIYCTDRRERHVIVWVVRVRSEYLENGEKVIILLLVATELTAHILIRHGSAIFQRHVDVMFDVAIEVVHLTHEFGVEQRIVRRSDGTGNQNLDL